MTRGSEESLQGPILGPGAIMPAGQVPKRLGVSRRPRPDRPTTLVMKGIAWPSPLTDHKVSEWASHYSEIVLSPTFLAAIEEGVRTNRVKCTVLQKMPATQPCTFIMFSFRLRVAPYVLPSSGL